MTEFTAKELEGKTSEQLATLGERNNHLSAEGILIKNINLQGPIDGSCNKYNKPNPLPGGFFIT